MLNKHFHESALGHGIAELCGIAEKRFVESSGAGPAPGPRQVVDARAVLEGELNNLMITFDDTHVVGCKHWRW